MSEAIYLDVLDHSGVLLSTYSVGDSRVFTLPAKSSSVRVRTAKVTLGVATVSKTEPEEHWPARLSRMEMEDRLKASMLTPPGPIYIKKPDEAALTSALEKRLGAADTEVMLRKISEAVEIKHLKARAAMPRKTTLVEEAKALDEKTLHEKTLHEMMGAVHGLVSKTPPPSWFLHGLDPDVMFIDEYPEIARAMPLGSSLTVTVEKPTARGDAQKAYDALPSLKRLWNAQEQDIAKFSDQTLDELLEDAQTWVDAFTKTFNSMKGAVQDEFLKLQVDNGIMVDDYRGKLERESAHRKTGGFSL